MEQGFLSKRFRDGIRISIEDYQRFIDGNEYEWLCTAYKYVFMIKQRKLSKKLYGIFRLLTNSVVLRTYLKYK